MMSNEEAKRLVRDGLILRKQRREAAAQEARMEAYEKEMISFCNGNCASAKKTRQKDAEMAESIALQNSRVKEHREQLIARRKLEREQMMKEMERDSAVMDAVRNFGIFCLVTALVTVWTPFPWWAAVALVAGCTALAAAYIFRLYCPAE